MVRREDDQGVVRRANLAERLQQAADLRVDVARQRVVGAAHSQDVRLFDRGTVAAGEEPVPPAVRIACFERNVRDPGRVDLDAVISFPPARRREIGIVGRDERDGERERPVVATVRVLVQPAHGLELGLVVVGDVDAAPVRSDIEHPAHVVIPLEPGLVVEPPVRRPQEVGRIDVGGDSLLVAVELVGTDEVHLAGETGPVAGAAQVVVEGGYGSGKLDRVVERTDPRRQPPAQHREPRRRAEREVAVGVLEYDASLGETVEMRGPYARVAVGGQHLGRELVRHDEENVRALCHRTCSSGRIASPTVNGHTFSRTGTVETRGSPTGLSSESERPRVAHASARPVLTVGCPPSGPELVGQAPQFRSVRSG